MNRMALKVSYEMALHTAVSKRHLDSIKASKHKRCLLPIWQ